jgi:hypothetical protein
MVEPIFKQRQSHPGVRTLKCYEIPPSLKDLTVLLKSEVPENV